MANTSPLPPNLTCPVSITSPDRYFTTEQSVLNVTRKDKFRLVMDIPKMLKPIIQNSERRCNGGNLEKLQISIWGFVVPEIQINTLEKSYGGQNLKFSGLSRKSFPAISVKFTIDNKFDNYYILYKWLDIQNDDEYSTFDAKRLNNDSKGHVNEYATTFTIYALDEYETPTAKWEYFGAFPTTLGSIEANYRDSEELESSFTFDFSQIKMSLL